MTLVKLNYLALLDKLTIALAMISPLKAMLSVLPEAASLRTRSAAAT